MKNKKKMKSKLNVFLSKNLRLYDFSNLFLKTKSITSFFDIQI